MRGIQGRFIVARASQQLELAETVDLVQVGLAIAPDIFEAFHPARGRLCMTDWSTVESSDKGCAAGDHVQGLRIQQHSKCTVYGCSRCKLVFYVEYATRLVFDFRDRLRAERIRPV